MSGIYKCQSNAPVSDFVTKFVGDDWVFPFSFTDSSGAPIDMSSSTFSAQLVTSTTSYPISGANGSIDQSGAASGNVSVTVESSLTSTLTPDLDSVDIPNDGRQTYYTRLALYTSSPTINTEGVVPVRVAER